MNRSNKGFTLIELLVVIAIIGVLSSIVLASLNTARGKGADVAIKGNLEGIRVSAEMQYDTLGLGCYANSGTCSASAPAATAGACPAAGVANIFGQTSISGAMVSALAASGVSNSFTSCNATVGGTQWAAAARLKQDPTKAWCVDSTGASREISNATAYTQAALDADIVGGVCGS